MIKVTLVALLAAATASLPALAQAPAPTTPAAPQGQEDMMRMMHLAARNQLGVLEYCQNKGSVAADTVALQKRMLTLLPPTTASGLDAAEEAGKAGKVQFAGNEVVLSDAAKRQNTTEDAMCKQMETMLKTQAANLPK